MAQPYSLFEMDDIQPGDFIEVNDETCRMLGYSREKLLKMNRMNLEEPRSLEELKDRFRTLRERKHGLHETTFLTKRGKVVPVEVNTNLVELDGQPVVLSIARDASERKWAG